MFLSIKTVAFDQHRAALFHCPFNHRTDALIEDRVTNGLMTGQFSEVRGYSMPGVQREEFTFDKGHQVIG